jgi:hypothetical protein
MSEEEYLQRLKHRPLGRKQAGTFKPADVLARNVVEGATAGLSKYPEAAARTLAGENFNDALASIRQRRDADRADYPILSTAGVVGGSILPIARIGQAAKGLGKVGSMAVAGGAYGAGQGFSENAAADQSTLRDMGISGGIGVLSGAAGGALQKWLEKGVRSQAVSGVKNIPITPMDEQQLLASVKSMKDKTYKSDGVTMAGVPYKRGDLNAAGQAHFDKLKAKFIPLKDAAHAAKSDTGNFGQSFAKTLGKGAKDTTSMTMMGALSGAVGAPMLGQDPMHGALGGAMAGFGLGKTNLLNSLGNTARHYGTSAALKVLPVEGTGAAVPAATAEVERWVRRPSLSERVFGVTAAPQPK